MNEAEILLEKVIEKDYCIGCGACTIVPGSPFKVHMDRFGNMVAYMADDKSDSETKVLDVCPFSERSLNEDQLGDIFFKGNERSDKHIGKYLKCFAGFVQEGELRKTGSSGGFARWLGYVLLKEREIDFYVHVLPNQTKDPKRLLFDYHIATSPEEVLEGARSAYYPVTLADILPEIKKREGRYAITALPCFAKALRLLSLRDDDIKSRLKYTIGLICGGMKSANQAKMIGWQLGVHPENLVAIDFRRKYTDKPASYKIYQVWSNLDDKVRYRDSYEIYATDWGAGYFKPNACDYCDDVVNETADISVGDAWLPQFEQDPKGTSLIIVRNKALLEIIEKKFKENIIHLSELTAEDVIKAQAGGFRHRREGLSYRLAKKEKMNMWHPPKRIQSNEFKLTRKRRRLYNQREKIARKSHIAFLHALEKNSLEIFYKEMKPLVRRYHAMNYGILPIRAIKKIKRILVKFLNSKIS